MAVNRVCLLAVMLQTAMSYPPSVLKSFFLTGLYVWSSIIYNTLVINRRVIYTLPHGPP